MPGFVDVCRVIKHYETLNLCSSKERGECTSSLPSQNSQPSNDIA
jgi:hypothetical protein